MFNNIKQLSDFDTEGYDEYDKKGFNNYIKANNINVSTTLDKWLNTLDPSNKFSEKEIKYIRAFRTWLHSDFEDAIKYVSNKINFDCNSNEDFVKRYKFFNSIAYFIFENNSISYETDIRKREKFIFNILKEKTSKNKVSFFIKLLIKRLYLCH